MDLDRPNPLRVTCAPGIEPYLRQELEALGYLAASVQPTSMDLTGSLRDCMRLNLHLRTAIAVLYRLDEFVCPSPDHLYQAVAGFAWEDLIPADGYLSVDSRGDHPLIRNWIYANQKVKDAIVDRIQERVGRRPDSGPDRRGVVINVYWKHDHCWLYLNTSGDRLSNRGYRRIPHKAPMVETLAAAVLLASGYDGAAPLVNPMCGSGTLAIEAALIAAGRAPGLLRSNYGLMHVRGFDAEAWNEVRRAAARARTRRPPARIIATDIDAKAVAAARANAKTAGVDHLIEFGVCDFAETPIPGEPGIVLLNPEYGRRLGESTALEQTYERIGDFFKQRCKGHTGYILTASKELAKKVGLRASRRIPFYNAHLECRLLRYELYEGTRRRNV